MRIIWQIRSSVFWFSYLGAMAANSMAGDYHAAKYLIDMILIM
jgi:hypothetical protein